jgi:FtsH-binding integral membrane protein
MRRAFAPHCGFVTSPDREAGVVGALTIPILSIWRAGRSRTRFRASGATGWAGAAPRHPAGAPEIKREEIPMSDFDRNYATAARGVGAGRAVAIDAGLRAYMIQVYNYMAIGVALTGAAAWIVFQMAVNEVGGQMVLTPFGQTLFQSGFYWVLLFAPLGLVFFISFRIQHLAPSTARALFFFYAALLGVSLAPIFLIYTHASVARVFFISAASFGALSLYGYTTQRDLSPIGSFLMMGLFGLILASLVAVFFPSPGLSFIISIAGVLIFAGLTAWDTQRIKDMYSANDDGTVAGRKAVMGALQLYLDFINMFMFLLRLMGDRR